MNDWEHEAAEREMDVLHEQIAALQAELHAERTQQQITITERCLLVMKENERLQNERDNWMETARFHLRNEEYYRKERDDLFATVAKHEIVIASLVSLLASGAGEDSFEYRWALELIDTPPDGDASAHKPGADTPSEHD